jgi:predicted nucleic acid-binding protein
MLVDAGPMVAVLSANDQHHSTCVEALPRLRGPLLTVWPAVAEAMHLLARWPNGPDLLLGRFASGAFGLLDLDSDDVPRIRELMAQYRDLPMDLADAALVRVAERERITTVFTIDRRDFALYRPKGFRRFRIVP